MPKKKRSLILTIHPLTIDRWPDFERLFGKQGACGGCWCMWWRLPRKKFEEQKGDGNRRAMKRIVRSGEVPGLLAYHEKEPVGWCALAPRERFTGMARSRILKPVDDQPCWSIPCFYINKKYRKQAVSVQLLKAAVMYARRQGATILEGYPIEPKKDEYPDTFAYTGFAKTFIRAGFKEVARRSPTRPIMRIEL